MDGLLLIDKPAGWTSFDVVNKVRSTLSNEYKVEGKKYKVYPPKTSDKFRRVKVGHSGTLDPFATGLLILAIGKATKQLQELTGLDKTYEATLELGKTSTTGDPEGEVSKVEDGRSQMAKNEVEQGLNQFVGEIEQVPPKFSAIKVDGKRAYKLAREGKEVVIPPRKVTIHQIELLDYNYPTIKISCNVSKGTYIRTLAEDIGLALGTGAYLTQLRRTRIGDYGVEGAIDPSSDFERLQGNILSVVSSE